LGDQIFLAQRVVQLGVGPRKSSFYKLTADKLAAAIQMSVTDQRLQVRAAQLGKIIRTVDGAGQAAALIQKFLGKSG
jgi:sterol 3beta-glucosyltransferase